MSRRPMQMRGVTMQKIINWMNENKVQIGFVGAAIVITTQWFTCSLEPTSLTEDKQQEEAQDASIQIQE